MYVRQKERGINPHWDTVFESCRKHGQNVQSPQKALVQPCAALRQLAVCSWWTVLLIRKHWGTWGKPGTQISYLENLQNILDFWFHAFSSVFYFCVVPSLLLTFPSGPTPALWGSLNSQNKLELPEQLCWSFLTPQKAVNELRVMVFYLQIYKAWGRFPHYSLEEMSHPQTMRQEIIRRHFTKNHIYPKQIWYKILLLVFLSCLPVHFRG